MRDLVILSIVVAGAISAIRRPWIGVLLWTWISIMNPHRQAWGIAYDAPVAAIAAAATFIGLFITKERRSPFNGTGTPVVILALLSVWVTLSWLFGLDVSKDYAMWNRVMKIYLMTFVAMMLLDHKQKIIAFVWVATLSIALMSAKGGLFVVATGGGYRVWGPAESFIADNNHFALAVVMTIPLLRFLQLQLKSALLRSLIAVAMVLSGIAALGSYSRGALLAITAMASMLWFRSESKVLIGGAIALLALVVLPMMPEAWWSRMQTIETYESDASAMGRINAWRVAFSVAMANFFGGGMSYQHDLYFSMYGVYENTVRAAHSVYFQILGNHGFVGLALYLLFLMTTYRYAGWLRRAARDNPQSRWAADLGGMAQVSLVGFFVGGAFLSMPYFDLPYDLMVMIVLARKWVIDRAWTQETEATLVELLGVRSRKVGERTAK